MGLDFSLPVGKHNIEENYLDTAKLFAFSSFFFFLFRGFEASGMNIWF